MYGQYDSDYPIIVGLSGLAGSGKTSTASTIITSVPAQSTISWEHLYHAMPLYEFAAIKTKTIGQDVESRQLHVIHDMLRDLFRSTVSYEDMVELAYDIYAMPIDKEGKPRDFLQALGSLLRSYDVDVFSNWVLNRSNQLFRQWRSITDEEDRDNPFIVLVSDLRMLNEIKNIKNTPNGIVIRFAASEEVRSDRLYSRDSKLLTPEQQAHETEMESQTEEFLSYVDLEINTDNMTLEDQALKTVEHIYQHIGLLENANK